MTTPYLDSEIRLYATQMRKYRDDHPTQRHWRDRYERAIRIRALRREGCPPRAAAPLAEAGYAGLDAVQRADDDALRDLPGMGGKTFAAIRAWAPRRAATAPPTHPWWLTA